MILDLGDTQLAYEVAGSGSPMLFLSATAWDRRPWQLHQVPEFARDHTVIVFDQRGTGQSPTRSTDFSTVRLAADAAALLDHLGFGGAIVCGHSNGGRVSQQLALDHPRKVAKLILASSGATHGTRGIPIGMIVQLVEKGYEGYVRDLAVETGCSKAYYATHRAEFDAFLNVRMQNLPTLESFLRHVLGRQEGDTTSRLGELRVPTLVMVGDDEDHGGSGTTHFAFAKILAEKIAGAQLVIFPDEGHYYPFLSPAPTHAAMRAFLGAR